MDYPKVGQKSNDDRAPYPSTGNSEQFSFALHDATAFLEEVEQLHMRLKHAVARMGRYGIAVLPEMTRQSKRVKGADELKAFMDVLEDTLNWEIRCNICPLDKPPEGGVSDVSD